MAFDALSLSVIKEELEQTLVGGKINKIYQPERDEILLFIFNKVNHKLLISANASVNRIHTTAQTFDNPAAAPAFCMLLRKHLTGAVIESIYQQELERVLDFTLRNKNELGYARTMHLIFELTGKTSNLILAEEDYTVLDTLKHLPQDLDAKRVILNGAKYTFFPPQNKVSPFDCDAVANLIVHSAQPLRSLLTENLLGVSEDTVREVLFGVEETHSVQNALKICERLRAYRQNLHDKRPNIVFTDGSPLCVCPFDYQSRRGEKIFKDTLCEAHDEFYRYLDKYQRFRDKAKSVSTLVKNAVSRTEKKLAIQRQSLLESEESERNKVYGDLILANLHRIQTGMSAVSAVDYGKEDCPTVVIPLDTALSPQQNAQKYYKKYRKLKSAAQHNEKLIAENEKLLDWLLSVRQSLTFCNETSDLAEIQAELVAAGLIKEKKAPQAQKAQPSKPFVYRIDGYTVYVGKNNTQNNFVTFRLAGPEDVWLHTHSIHSSHAVILSEGGPVPEKVIEKTAEIVAYFSRARQSGKTVVDYTEKKHVKKPSGAPLGFVTYAVCRSVVVLPNEHLESRQN